ncbi:hypothetical protein ASD16_10490 [Cellulomonas sp. Root485]|jgi:hypothetical protein|uniref:hypothetical protein n=1 Tax=Cellulomonas sp. Root485 TaxID=1736546 RepID=UPI0006F489C1|nr:hypothetical protein [Cellulomonas sp. Root485]KQY23013.1 hypothetical protein ASD16_10490 [Cellulomonas sp. Root485]
MTSRYADSGTYEVTLPDGTVVTVLRVPAPTSAPVVGWHRRSSDERLDLVAHRFLHDATAGWRLCDANGVIAPDALAARDLIAIPGGERP